MKQPYRLWTIIELETQLKKQCFHYKLNLTINQMVDEALNDTSWNPLLEYDGCTLVQDKDHPCISCFLHDYHWISGRGGWKSNKIFYHIMLATGFKKSEAKRRLIGVNLAWYFYYKYKHLIKRNVNPFTEGMGHYLKHLKNLKNA